MSGSLKVDPFLNAVVRSAKSGAQNDGTAVLMTKNADGTFTFRNVTRKSASGFFVRSQNRKLRQQLFESLKSAGESLSVPTDELAESLGLCYNKGREVFSPKPLTNRDICNIVQSHFGRIRHKRQAQTLKDVLACINDDPQCDLGAKSPTLKKLAAELAHVNDRTPYGDKFMEAVASRFLGQCKNRHDDMKNMSGEELLERFARECETAGKILRTQVAKNEEVAVCALGTVEVMRNGLPLATAGCLKILLANAVDDETDAVIKKFETGESVDVDAFSRAVDARFAKIISVFDGVSGESPLDVLAQTVTKSLGEDKLAGFSQKLDLFVKYHPELGAKVKEAFGDGLGSLVDALREQVLKPYSQTNVVWSNDVVDQTEKVKEQCRILVDRLENFLGEMEDFLVEETGELMSADCVLKMRAKCLSDVGATNGQLVQLALRSDSQVAFIGDMLKALVQKPTHLESNDPFHSILAEQLPGVIDDTKGGREVQALAQQVAKTVRTRLDSMTEGLEEAARKDVSTAHAFNLPNSASSELHNLAVGAKSVLDAKWSQWLAKFLQDPKPADVKTDDVRKQVLEPVRKYLQERDFENLYQTEIANMYRTSASEAAKKIQAAQVAFEETVRDFNPTCNVALPEAMRIGPDMVGADVRRRYESLLNQAVSQKLAEIDLKREMPDLKRLPSAPDPKATAAAAMASAEKAVGILSEVVQAVGGELEKRGLTWLVSPDQLKVRAENFSSATDNGRVLDNVLKGVRDRVVRDVNAGKVDSVDVKALAEEVMKCVETLADEARQYRKSNESAVNFFAANLTWRIMDAPKNASFGDEQVKAIKTYVLNLCKKDDTNGLGAVEDRLREEFQVAIGKATELLTSAVKKCMKDKITPDVKDIRIPSLLGKATVKYLVRNVEVGDFDLLTRQLYDVMSEKANAASGNLKKALEDKVYANATFPGAKDFYVGGTDGWLAGHPAEGVKSLVRIFAERELAERKGVLGSSLDSGEVLEAAERRFVEAIPDIKTILYEARKKASAEERSQSKLVLGVFKWMRNSYSEEVSKKYERVIADELSKYAMDPVAYRTQYQMATLLKK